MFNGDMGFHWDFKIHSTELTPNPLIPILFVCPFTDDPFIQECRQVLALEPPSFVPVLCSQLDTPRRVPVRPPAPSDTVPSQGRHPPVEEEPP